MTHKWEELKLDPNKIPPKKPGDLDCAISYGVWGNTEKKIWYAVVTLDKEERAYACGPFTTKAEAKDVGYKEYERLCKKMFPEDKNDHNKQTK